MAKVSLKALSKTVIALFAMMLLFSSSNAQTFTPGGDWYDVNGNKVYAVEGGIMKVGNLYYLWGMDRSQNNYTFRGVNLYSSPDLKTWTFVNTILSNSSHPDIAEGSVVERPKLLHNTSTGQFVLWVHYEGWNAYATSEVGYATSSTIGGNYTWQGHYRPLGLDSKDMNVFKDTDGKAYMISSISNNSQVVIMELNASYTGHVSEVYRGSGANSSSGFGCEGHALFKSGNTYFLIESYCSGWDTNDNRYYTATSLAGPWTSRGNIAPSGAKTYQSQVTYAFPVTGTSTTTYCFMGDRWSTGNYSMTSLIVLPIQVSGTTLSLPWYDQWTINTNTGAWSGSSINYDGEFRIVNQGSGKVMEVPSASTANNAQIKQYPWNGGAHQQWTITNLGRGEYRITNVNSGKVIDNPNGSRTAGTNVQQYDYTGSFNQRWHIIKNADGSYRIDNANSLGKTLEVANSSNSDGAGVVIGNNFNYSAHQTWNIVPVSGSGGGPQGYTLCSNEGETCTFSGTVNVAYGANGQFNYQYNVTGGSIACNNATFGDPINGVVKACYVQPVSGGGSGTTYQLKNRGTGMVIDGWGLTANGSVCNQNLSSSTHPNTYWQMIDAGSSQGTFYYFQNVGTGMKLDGMGRTSSGSDVGQYANTTTHVNSQWIVQQYSGSYYRIQNRGTGLYLDGMGRTAVGSACGQYANTTHVNAQWELVPVSSGARMGEGSELESAARSSGNTEEVMTLTAYPNPFKEKAFITISLSQPSDVTIELFSSTGSRVKKYNFGKLQAGSHDLELDGKNLKADMYIFKAFINGAWQTGKLVKID